MASFLAFTQRLALVCPALNTKFKAHCRNHFLALRARLRLFGIDLLARVALL